MKKYISAVALMLAMFGASAQQQTKNGVAYTILNNGSGEKTKVDDVITFNIEQRTSTDSLLFSSYKMGRPIQIRVKPSQNMMDLMDIFVLMAPGDSAVVQIPTDSIFKGREEERPPFVVKGTAITTRLKLEKVQTMGSFMADKNAELEKLKAAEAAEAGKYIIANKLNPITTASGLKYIITTPSAKPKGKNTDTVLVNYTGRTLEGKVFDSSVAEEAQKAGLQQPGREYKPIEVILGTGGVIKGWEEALLLLGEGAKAKLIIPSHLGYGERGAGADIKPYSTLVFDVEVVKIKRTKVFTAVPKKRVSTKPAAKSTVKPAAKKPAPAKTPVSKKKN